MSGHVGIVACSAEGAALCYRTLCIEGAGVLGGHAHPEVSLHGLSLEAYTRCIDAGDWAGVGELMLVSAEKLAAVGAEVLICPDNTIHRAFAHIESRLPRPWLHIVDAVAAAAREHGYLRLGLTGTRWLVDSEVYPERLQALGVEFARPDPIERDALHRVIMDELVHGVFSDAALATMQQVIASLEAQGCDAVVLGCTELPLLLDGIETALPTLDSTRLLARRALAHALR